MTPIPMKLNEAGNAALLIMLLFASSYLALYLAREWRQSEPGTTLADFRTRYTNKAAFGLLTVFSGFGLKSGASWYSLHIVNNGGAGPHMILLTAVYVAGTLLSLWGVICTMRALSPYEWRRYTWAVVSIAAVVIGVIMAL